MTKAELLAEHDRLTGLLGLEQRSRFSTRRSDLLKEIRQLKKQTQETFAHLPHLFPPPVRRRRVLDPPDYGEPLSKRRPLRSKRVDRRDSDRLWELFEIIKEQTQAFRICFAPVREDWEEFETLLAKKVPRRK